MTAFELKARAFAKALDWGVPRLRRVAIRNLELAGFADPNTIANGVFLSVGRIMASVAQVSVDHARERSRVDSL